MPAREADDAPSLRRLKRETGRMAGRWMSPALVPRLPSFQCPTQRALGRQARARARRFAMDSFPPHAQHHGAHPPRPVLRRVSETCGAPGRPRRPGALAIPGPAAAPGAPAAYPVGVTSTSNSVTLDALLLAWPEALIIVDASGTIVSANDAACMLLRIGPHHGQGLRLSDFVGENAASTLLPTAGDVALHRSGEDTAAA